MRALIRAAARLYPTRWRARYAREFDGLLEDLEPTWLGLFNVVYGALTMQIKRAGVVAVVCAAIGVVVAGVASLRMPETYASTATLRLPSTDESFLKHAQQAHAGEPLEVKERASVTIEVPVDEKTRSTMLTVTFADRDPEKAREVTERLLGSVLTANGIPSGSIWTARTGPNRPMVAGTGGTVGLMLGALLIWFRREPTSER
jgi:uncharacterized protein involved in exopolysaccharide biosynthesis